MRHMPLVLAVVIGAPFAICLPMAWMTAGCVRHYQLLGGSAVDLVHVEYSPLDHTVTTVIVSCRTTCVAACSAHLDEAMRPVLAECSIQPCQHVCCLAFEQHIRTAVSAGWYKRAHALLPWLLFMTWPPKMIDFLQCTYQLARHGKIMICHSVATHTTYDRSKTFLIVRPHEILDRWLLQQVFGDCGLT